VPKKSRTPPPPRRPVQAPQRRVQKHERPDANRRRRLLLLLFVASGVVAVAAVAVVIAVAGGGTGGSSGKSDADVAAAMHAAGCTFKTVKSPPHSPTHGDVPTLTSKVHWNTFPPSNGMHYGLWAVWGFYTEPVNPRNVVHNEEHGGIVLWWGPQTPQSEIDQLHALYESSPNSMFGTPIISFNGQSLGSKVAITAWTGEPTKYFRNGYFGFGHVAVCPKFDEKAFTTFRDAYRGHGPEGIPTSLNNPGEGPQ
jgi:hypothetical protein